MRREDDRGDKKVGKHVSTSMEYNPNFIPAPRKKL
jgi:hypothetical protein